MLLDKIINIVDSNIPKSAYRSIFEKTNSFSKEDKIIIKFATSDYNINNVSGQHPHRVGLLLNLVTMELDCVNFGGMGRRSVYRQPNKELREEKYLAMFGEKVPFRKPQKTEKAVLKAIEKFTKNWVALIVMHEKTILYKDHFNIEDFKSM